MGTMKLTAGLLRPVTQNKISLVGSATMSKNKVLQVDMFGLAFKCQCAE